MLDERGLKKTEERPLRTVLGACLFVTEREGLELAFLKVGNSFKCTKTLKAMCELGSLGSD